MSYIADYFQNNNLQTPFFVNQAKLTETFIDDLLPIKENLKSFSNILEISENTTESINENINEDTQKEECAKNLFEIIKQDNENCINKDQAMVVISDILRFFSEVNQTETLVDFFDLETKCLASITGLANITKLFQEIQAKEKDFYIILETTEEEYEEEIQVPKKRSNLGSALLFRGLNMYEEYDLKTVKRKRDILCGFEHSLKTPGSGYTLKLLPKFMNINTYVFNIIFIFNNREIIFYYNKIEYSQKNWSDWIIQNYGKWEKQICPFIDKDIIFQSLNEIITTWQTNVFNVISNKFIK
jgi:hypothetical protein